MASTPEAEANLPHEVNEVPANGTDSSRGDYLPTVAMPTGLDPDHPEDYPVG